MCPGDVFDRSAAITILMDGLKKLFLGAINTWKMLIDTGVFIAISRNVLDA